MTWRGGVGEPGGWLTAARRTALPRRTSALSHVIEPRVNVPFDPHRRDAKQRNQPDPEASNENPALPPTVCRTNSKVHLSVADRRHATARSHIVDARVEKLPCRRVPTRTRA